MVYVLIIKLKCTICAAPYALSQFVYEGKKIEEKYKYASIFKLCVSSVKQKNGGDTLCPITTFQNVPFSICQIVLPDDYECMHGIP